MVAMAVIGPLMQIDGRGGLELLHAHIELVNVIFQITDQRARRHRDDFPAHAEDFVIDHQHHDNAAVDEINAKVLDAAQFLALEILDADLGHVVDLVLHAHGFRGGSSGLGP